MRARCAVLIGLLPQAAILSDVTWQTSEKQIGTDAVGIARTVLFANGSAYTALLDPIGPRASTSGFFSFEDVPLLDVKLPWLAVFEGPNALTTSDIVHVEASIAPWNSRSLGSNTLWARQSLVMVQPSKLPPNYMPPVADLSFFFGNATIVYNSALPMARMAVGTLQDHSFDAFNHSIPTEEWTSFSKLVTGNFKGSNGISFPVIVRNSDSAQVRFNFARNKTQVAVSNHTLESQLQYTPEVLVDRFAIPAVKAGVFQWADEQAQMLLKNQRRWLLLSNRYQLQTELWSKSSIKQLFAGVTVYKNVSWATADGPGSGFDLDPDAGLMIYGSLLGNVLICNYTVLDRYARAITNATVREYIECVFACLRLRRQSYSILRVEGRPHAYDIMWGYPADAVIPACDSGSDDKRPDVVGHEGERSRHGTQDFASIIL